jgi:heme oxygenase (biliverdin-IX-beta and delta-forming)
MHLEGMWGFYADLEQKLGEKLHGNVLSDYDTRRKLPLLTADLIALGADSDSLLMLPRCRAAPECADPAAAFGCAYVLEGATLGGRTLLPLVENRLGLTAAHGAMFLASYGETITFMWQNFAAALDRWCVNPQRLARAKDAAVATFDALSDWLCERPS